MKKTLQTIWRAATTPEFRAKVSRVRIALGDGPMIAAPTYAEDGLISAHVTEFPPKFAESYALGRSTGALDSHPGDIKFRAYVCCWAANYASRLDGDFVECGVGKGLLSRTLTHYLDFERSPKKLYLFDTFEGIPLEHAGDSAEQVNMATLNKSHFNQNYLDAARTTFAKYPNVVVVAGRVPESLDVGLGKIAYISIDMNNAFAEAEAIKYLWDKLVPGGVVVLDDYAYGPEFIAQKRAMDSFAASKGFEILTLPTGQGMIIK